MLARNLLGERLNMHRVDEDSTGADLFDREQLRNYVVFVGGSVRRRKGLVVAVMLSILALAILALLALPRTYHVEAKLLAQRSQVLAVRGDGPDAVAPTRGAAETVQRRDNLVAIIQATDLVQHYHDHRALAQRMVDAVAGLFHGEESEQDRIDAMVELLEKRLVAWTSEGTVSIAIDWPDAKMGCRVVEMAQQNFLETRYAQEITALAESISILQGHAANLTADINDAVAGVARLRADSAPQNPGEPVMRAGTGRAAAAPRPAAPGLADERSELAQLKLSIDAKQRAIDDLDTVRRRRLAEVQTRLIELRATYTENHPVIVDLQQTIAALSPPSQQVKALNQEVASLRSDYDRKSAGATSAPGLVGPAAAPAPGVLATPPQLPSEILRLDQQLREDRDPTTVYARGQLRDAMDKYSALRAQVQTAQIDLETAQAAFKYRYSVLTPPQLPRKPAKPNALLVLLAAFIAGLFGAVVIAVMADVRAGRLVERWQIEQLLDRPILGEVSFPLLPRPDSE
jgi:uncharacterized protein involved in exopolysaccharide biosynthesis